MKKLVCVCLILLSLCLCSCEALAIGGGLAILGEIMDDSADTASNQSTNTSSASSYGINQAVIVNDLEYTVLSVYNTTVIDSFFEDGKTDNNFIVITLKIKNNSSSEKSIWSSNFYYYRGNSKYEVHDSGLYLDGGFWLSDSIGSGITKTIKIVYEIPSESQSTDFLQVKDSYKAAKIYMK